MVNLDPFLANFNPIVRYLDYYAPVVTDFLANPAAAAARCRRRPALPEARGPDSAQPTAISRGRLST